MKNYEKKHRHLFLTLTLAGLLLWGNTALAQQWKTANQVTVSWDAVTVPSGVVTYRTYTKPESGGVETLIGTVTPTQATITFTAEGRYFLGVQSVRTVDSVEVGVSTISWSNNAEVCQSGVTFGVQYFIPPDAPKNLKL